MRHESVELLSRVFRDHLSSNPHTVGEGIRRGLSGEDILFLVQAIEVVATYKVPHDLDQDSTQQRRQEILEDMEIKLRALDYRRS